MIDIARGQVVQDYKSHLQWVEERIAKGPFKIEYLCDKLGVSRVTFYNKRKKRSFNLVEIEILTDLFEKV